MIIAITIVIIIGTDLMTIIIKQIIIVLNLSPILSLILILIPRFLVLLIINNGNITDTILLSRRLSLS